MAQLVPLVLKNSRYHFCLVPHRFLYHLSVINFKSFVMLYKSYIPIDRLRDQLRIYMILTPNNPQETGTIRRSHKRFRGLRNAVGFVGVSGGAALSEGQRKGQLGARGRSRRH